MRTYRLVTDSQKGGIKRNLRIGERGKRGRDNGEKGDRKEEDAEAGTLSFKALLM